MISLKKAISLQTGQKFLMALTGLGLAGFTVTHLLGNLTLFDRTGRSINQYAATLESYGIFLEMAEIGLLGLFILHIVTAIRLKVKNKAARPVSYYRHETKGGVSKWNFSSTKMVFTGIALLAFVILHVKQFKYGPSIAAGYSMQVDGKEIRDLHRLVSETFHQPLFVAIYVAAMILFGLHLRHGFWSAFQSLGLAFPKYTQAIYCLGVFIAFALAIGFLSIPVWMYFN